MKPNSFSSSLVYLILFCFSSDWKTLTNPLDTPGEYLKSRFVPSITFTLCTCTCECQGGSLISSRADAEVFQKGGSEKALPSDRHQTRTASSLIKNPKEKGPMFKMREPRKYIRIYETKGKGIRGESSWKMAAARSSGGICM
ncbi:hypothetical protein GWI33_005030 [Rhynchophorus ferrugineus]|uniref:Uncharacterized protein n=1 Tax=Rhynchophorus ferrugineus TaxID=354439 RepID=A0A834IHF0_RHYFE|nr:hypothetical protein GWI33_005030 [Rhynchophorus ferrugineus]